MAFIEHLCTGTENENLEDISGTCVEERREENKKKRERVVILMSLEEKKKLKVERSSCHLDEQVRCRMKINKTFFFFRIVTNEKWIQMSFNEE